MNNLYHISSYFLSQLMGIKGTVENQDNVLVTEDGIENFTVAPRTQRRSTQNSRTIHVFQSNFKMHVKTMLKHVATTYKPCIWVKWLNGRTVEEVEAAAASSWDESIKATVKINTPKKKTYSRFWWGVKA